MTISMVLCLHPYGCHNSMDLLSMVLTILELEGQIKKSAAECKYFKTNLFQRERYGHAGGENRAEAWSIFHLVS